jgi:nucleoside triphosphate diphosphatase
MEELLEVMARLRDPERGCPWDVAQTFATIAPYTLEEAFEVADAIERGDLAALREELGDLLFQVVFHARLAEEQGAVRLRRGGRGPGREDAPPAPARVRHADIADAEAQTQAWERTRRASAPRAATGALDDVPSTCRRWHAPRSWVAAPRAWASTGPRGAVLDKLAEERVELEAAMRA